MKSAKEIKRYDPNYLEGLSTEIVNERIKEGLVNSTKGDVNNTLWSIIRRNVFTFFNLIYVVIFVLLVIAKVDISNYLFVVIVLTNLTFALFQEIRSKIKVDHLKLISADKVKVIRNSTLQEINKEELVLDDIVVYVSNNQVVSDAVIKNGTCLVNESQLTGESDAITKNPGDTIYSGSYLISGNISCRVDKIKDDNEFSKLNKIVKKTKKPSSQIFSSLNLILRIISIIIVPVGLTMFFITYNGLEQSNLALDTLTNYQKFQISMEKTAGAVLGMIPSGLYLLTTVSLSVGALILSRKQILVNNVYSLENLARCDVICLDKTGTITDGSMKVVDYVGIDYDKGKLYDLIACLNEALNEQNFTAQAINDYFGFKKNLKVKKILPFNSDNKYSAVQFGNNKIYAMGAPDILITNPKVENYHNVKKMVEEYTRLGYRVICVAEAKRIMEKKITKDNKPIGLIVIEDNIRPDADKIIEYFQENDVEVKLISGDNPLTVEVIARKVGIKNAEKIINVSELSDEELKVAALKYTIFGRVKPHQKQIIIKALKDAKHNVAMTGDGINDILALKEANCSIAMATGSDAVKNVSDIVLVDSKFSNVPDIIKQGRRVANNIQRTSSLYLVKTIFIIILSIVFITGFMKRFGPTDPNSYNSFPISPSQLLLIEVFAIGVPAFFLSLQPNYKRVSGHFLDNLFQRSLPGALAVVFEVMATYIFSKLFGLNQEQVSTIIIVVATITCMIILFIACKPFNKSSIIIYLTMLIMVLFIMIASITGLEKPINFQKQFKLYDLVTHNDQIVQISLNELPGSEMEKTLDTGTLLGYLNEDGSYTLVNEAELDEALFSTEERDYFDNLTTQEIADLRTNPEKKETYDRYLEYMDYLELVNKTKELTYTIYKYSFKVPSNINYINQGKDDSISCNIKVKIGNGNLTYTYSTYLNLIDNLYLGVDSEGNQQWIHYDDGIQSNDDTYTVYFRDLHEWENVYCYMYYEKTADVTNGTSLLLAVVLSQTSYVIIAIFGYVVGVIIDKRKRKKLLELKIFREELIEDEEAI